ILLEENKDLTNIEYNVEFDYYYSVYDIRANEFIDEFRISDEEYNIALKNINEMSILSIQESLSNDSTKDKKGTDIEELNKLFNEESNIIRLLEDSNQLTKKLIQI
ncbi:MAG: hypothetical protein ACRDD7_12410, partial [Peptostreptococcaceae bacterium]